MPENRKPVNYQGSITWFLGKATQKKKTPGSLYRQSATFQRWSAISTKIHPEKSTATSPPLDSASPMAKPSVKPTKPTPRKSGRPANNGTNKRAKKNWRGEIQTRRITGCLSQLFKARGEVQARRIAGCLSPLFQTRGEIQARKRFSCRTELWANFRGGSPGF